MASSGCRWTPGPHLVLVPLALTLALAAGCDDSDPAGPAPDAAADAPLPPPIDAAAFDGPSSLWDLPPYERPPAPPPPSGHGWTSRDIGNLGMNSGGLSLGGAVVVRGGGMDIGGTSDSCAFTFRKVSGDAEIVARVRSVQRADPASTAGIMIRADENDPASASVFFGLLADPSKGGQYVARLAAGQPSQASPPDPQLRNQFLRLRREGRRITLARSSDRLAWVKVGSVDLDLPAEAAVGLAVSARSATAPTAGEFDFVRLLTLDAAAAAAGWDLEPLGVALPMPTGSILGDRVSLNAAADELTTTFDNGAALLAPRTGNFTLTARVDSLGEGAPQARLSLTLREGGSARLNPTSRSVLLGVNAQGQVQFQRRDRSTNFDPGQARAGLRPPVWLRLVRFDDPATTRTTIAGLTSADGVTWTRLDAAEFATPDPIMVGLLWSSGSTSRFANVQLSQVSLVGTAELPPAPSDAGADAGGGQ